MIETRYQKVKEILFNRILRGEYPDRSFLPPERNLSELFQVSRITMRTALQLLEKEGLLERVQGRGTQVVYKKGAAHNSMTTVAVVSNFKGPFNAEYMSGINAAADITQGLIVFRERLSEENIFASNHIVHQLIQKNIKNMVIWTQRNPVNQEELKIISGLGVNLVFFDTSQNSAYADDVTLDNENAVITLGQLLKQNLKNGEIPNFSFFGCSMTQMSSTIEREQYFDSKIGGHKFLINVAKLNWQKDIFQSLKIVDANKCNGIFSANGYLALEIKKQILKSFPNLRNIKLVTIDNDEPNYMNEFKIDRISQPYFDFGKKSYELLIRQNEMGPNWTASKFLLVGKLILAKDE